MTDDKALKAYNNSLNYKLKESVFINDKHNEYLNHRELQMGVSKCMTLPGMIGAVSQLMGKAEVISTIS